MRGERGGGPAQKVVLNPGLSKRGEWKGKDSGRLLVVAWRSITHEKALQPCGRLYDIRTSTARIIS